MNKTMADETQSTTAETPAPEPQAAAAPAKATPHISMGNSRAAGKRPPETPAPEAKAEAPPEAEAPAPEAKAEAPPEAERGAFWQSQVDRVKSALGVEDLDAFLEEADGFRTAAQNWQAIATDPEAVAWFVNHFDPNAQRTQASGQPPVNPERAGHGQAPQTPASVASPLKLPEKIHLSDDDVYDDSVRRTVEGVNALIDALAPVTEYVAQAQKQTQQQQRMQQAYVETASNYVRLGATPEEATEIARTLLSQPEQAMRQVLAWHRTQRAAQTGQAPAIKPPAARVDPERFAQAHKEPAPPPPPSAAAATGTAPQAGPPKVGGTPVISIGNSLRRRLHSA